MPYPYYIIIQWVQKMVLPGELHCRFICRHCREFKIPIQNLHDQAVLTIPVWLSLHLPLNDKLLFKVATMIQEVSVVSA
jgi:hypothetical protein